MTEVNGLEPDTTRMMILNLENELARYSLTEKSAEVKQTTRACVYHILLRAITLSKDPTISVEEIKRLFDVAKELIVQAELGDEKELQGRLDDLINSLVDRSDISVQFSQFQIKAQGYFDTISAMLKQDTDLISEDLQNIHETMAQNKKMLSSMNKRRNIFKIITMAALAVLLFAVALFSSTVIIVIMLSTNSVDGVTLNKSKASTEIHYRKSPNEMG